MGDQDQKFKQNPFPTNFIIPSAPQMRSTRSSIRVRYFLPGRVMSTRNYGVSFHERRLLNLDKFAGSGRVSVSFVGSPLAHRSSSKLIDHHGLIRTRYGSTDSYQLTFIDDGKAYSARIVQIYINWARSLLLCQRGGVLHPSISWPCFSLV